MSLETNIYFFFLLLVLIFIIPLEGITVKPARCPTNKIAPHKRLAYYGQVESRIFGGAFYDLLSPGGGGGQPQDQLGAFQEQQQEDESDDCGDIEDYDESDLSSLSQPYMHEGQNANRFFFGGLLRPQSTTRPTTTVTYRPRPPYWSGGYFGNNHYRPPLHQNPSDQVKPVHDGANESPSTYRPDIVGGPLGHVVGHYPVRPSTRPPSYYTTQNRLQHYTRHPPPTTEATIHPTRPARPRMYNNDGILSSFVDLLLFK